MGKRRGRRASRIKRSTLKNSNISVSASASHPADQSTDRDWKTASSHLVGKGASIMTDPEDEIRNELVSRFGCAGHIVHVLALSAILAPAGCAGSLVMGDDPGWFSALLGLAAFLVVGGLCSIPVVAMIEKFGSASARSRGE